MCKPYMTREGGATVTVFVPYDCGNHCPFCINKQEYADTSGFSAEKIIAGIRELHAVTPRCDFVFTGGEPMAEPDTLQRMLDAIPQGHRIFINTTLPVLKHRSEDELLAFFDRNKDKITCVNVSRHLRPYVVECRDEILGRVSCPVRINCVLFGQYDADMLRAFIARFRGLGLPIQFRSDYTATTPENLYDTGDDAVFQTLSAIAPCTGAEGCRIRCNYDFGADAPALSYHKTLPYSTVPVTVDGTDYDVLYDVVIKQNGDLHSDWTGVPLDLERYRAVRFEPNDLKPFAPERP